MAGKSPTQNSLSALRANGYLCWVVEYFNRNLGPFGKRVDMFNMFDIIALRENEVLFVQTTSGSNVSARVKKITDNEWLADIRKAGVRVEIHGWAKKPKTKGSKVEVWKQRVVDLS